MGGDYRRFALDRFAGLGVARLDDAAAFVDRVLRAVLAVFRVADRVGFPRFLVVLPALADLALFVALLTLADLAVFAALLALARLVALVFVDFLACVAFEAEDALTDDVRGVARVRVIAGFAAVAAAFALRALAARTARADRWTIENRVWRPTA